VLKSGAELGRANVEPFVTLDDILSTFNKKVREAFRTWMIASAESFNGESENLNLSFADIPPFVESANRVLKLLVSQQGAVRALVRDTGDVFDALTERSGQLREFTVAGSEAFSAAARASSQWAAAFKQLPAFERNSSAALRSLNRLAADANPLLVQLKPAERALTPLVRQTERFAPTFDSFLTALGPLTKAAKSGLPALSKSLALTTPLLEALRPVLHNIDPFLQYTDEYLPSLQSFFANLTAASEAIIGNSNVKGTTVRQHYVRAEQYVGPESLAVYGKRIGTNRANPYSHPGAFSELASGLQVFSSASCANSAPSVEDRPNEQVSQQLIEQLIALKVVNAPGSTTNSVPAPACRQQAPFTFNGKTSEFPHVSASE
jgi:ABC-type transporter Mla subunit MlaD